MKTQKQWRKIWAKEITESKEPEKTLHKILKKQTPTWVRILDLFLMTALLIGVIYAHAEGLYDRVEIEVTCEDIQTYGLTEEVTSQEEAMAKWQYMINDKLQTEEKK